MLEIINKENLETNTDGGRLEVLPESIGDAPTNRPSTSADINWRDARPGKKLTEQALVQAAVEYADGRLPAVTANLPDVARPDIRVLASVPWLQRGLLSPRTSIAYTCARIIHATSLFGNLAGRIVFAAILPLLWFAWWEPEIQPVLAAVCLYFSIGVMVWCTARWLDTERRLDGEFAAWSRLLVAHNGELSARSAERLYLRRSLGFAGPLFAVAILTLVSSWGSAASSGLLAYGELMAFAAFIAFLTLVGRFWAAVAIVGLAFANYFAHEHSRIPLPAEPVAGWFAWPCLAALLAMPLGPVHTRTLLSLLVALAWLQVAAVCWSTAVPGVLAGAVRASLVLTCAVACIPLLGAGAAFLPAAAAARWLQPPLTASAVGGVIWLFACAAAARSERLARPFARAQTLAAILAFFFLFAHAYRTILEPPISPSDSPPIELNWEAYRETCHQPAWDNFGGNTAAVQERCHRLLEPHKNRLRVTWQGYVNEVKATRVRNVHVEWTSRLPSALREAMRCALAAGTRNEQDDDLPAVWHRLAAEGSCSLHNWDRYEHEISVRMQAGLWGGKSAELRLLASHAFTNFTSRLRHNDKVYFSGGLGWENDLSDGEPIAGGRSPRLTVDEIGCLACHDLMLSFYRLPSPYDYLSFLRAIFYNLLPPNPLPQIIQHL